jgi:hypothetical protein
MRKVNIEYKKHNECGKKSRTNGYHTVVKGCTDSLDTDELDLYRFLIGGVQGK